MNLRISFSISAKKALRIWKEIAVNLQVALGSGVILTRVLGATDRAVFSLARVFVTVLRRYFVASGVRDLPSLSYSWMLCLKSRVNGGVSVVP